MAYNTDLQAIIAPQRKLYDLCAALARNVVRPPDATDVGWATTKQPAWLDGYRTAALNALAPALALLWAELGIEDTAPEALLILRRLETEATATS